jgi:hypothetical protein
LATKVVLGEIPFDLSVEKLVRIMHNTAVERKTDGQSVLDFWAYSLPRHPCIM